MGDLPRRILRVCSDDTRRQLLARIEDCKTKLTGIASGFELFVENAGGEEADPNLVAYVAFLAGELLAIGANIEATGDMLLKMETVTNWPGRVV